MTGGLYKRGNKAFTTMEIIIVVLFSCLVCVATIPIVSHFQLKSEQTQLDAKARSIYEAAQSRAYYMRSEGGLAQVRSDVSQDGVLAGQVGTQPQDWIADSCGYPWTELSYMQGGATSAKATTTLLSGSTLSTADMTEGCYIIEANLQTGEVYGVFYSEKPFSYDDVLALANRADAPAAASMGYYGGTDVDTHTLTEAFAPVVSIQNGNELVADITCSGFRKYMDSSSGTAAINVQVSDEHGNTCSVNRIVSIDESTSDTITAKVTLDSMQQGKSFAELFSGQGEFAGTALQAGDDITVTAGASYTSFHNSNLEEYTTPSASATANSLFESKGSGNISISCPRHLNNLRSERYPTQLSSSMRIVQTADIDFAATDATSSTSAQDLLAQTGFQPIENVALFGDDDNAGKASFDGGGHTISGCNVSAGSQATGLFAVINGVSIHDVTLVDTSVSGHDSTGALVGRMHGGSIDGCGARLSNTLPDASRRSDMDARQAIYRVQAGTGSYCVGGLVGSADAQATIDNSYAACDVTAISGSIQMVGGLVGSLSDSIVQNSYASGSVASAGRDAGGLVGAEWGSTLKNCLSAGNVNAVQASGGLVGGTSGGTVSQCTSYGHVRDLNGQESITLGALSAPGASADFSDCAFLRQNGYNSLYAQEVSGGVQARSYRELVESASHAISKENTHSYDKALASLCFPFSAVSDEYWGDWPGDSLSSLGALAYYEKYEDGSTGYYMSMALTFDGNVVRDDTVNTLKDAVVTEDGYALVEPYALEQVSYQLNDGDENSLSVSDDAGSSQDLVLVDDSLEVQTSSGVFLDSLQVYRLPGTLQGIDTENRKSFFDKLVFTTSGERIDDIKETYYYNPDFAKTAIGPSEGNMLSSSTKLSDATPSTVSVRSARQLNALGRNMYWCTPHAGSGSDQFVFTQECDIDFSAYTKTYCGKAFDLTDTSEDNPYKNVPIGTSGNDVNLMFANVYDGQMHQIVDFCLETSTQQAAGLFGTISGATVKNVVMRASSSGSSYVHSSYTEHKDSYHSTPVAGSLVGCVYADATSSAEVKNCAMSGMQVSWSAPDADYEYNAAVGGLVGYNFGEVNNCSAVADEVSIGSADIDSNGNIRVMDSIGGLVGSNAGTVENCYAGGSLAYRAATSKAQVEMGGLCGHYFYYATTGRQRIVAKVTDCYSYATGRVYADLGSHGIAYYYQVANDAVENAGGTNISSTNSYRLDGYDILGCSFEMFSYQDPQLNYHSDDAISKSASELSELNPSQDFGRADVTHSYATFTDDSAPRDAYPYPAVVRALDGYYVHYGNWPAG